MKELFLINKTYKHIISISCTLDMLVKYFNIYDCMILYDLNKLCGLLVPKRRLAIILKRKHRLYRIINILFFNLILSLILILYHSPQIIIIEC